MMNNIRNMSVLFLSGILFGAIFVAGQYSRPAEASPGGILFVGADTEEFNGLQDKIGKFETNGPNVVGGGVIPLADGDYANGMTVIGDQLLTGTVGEPFNPAPSGQTLTFRDFDTVPQSTAVADIPAGAFNEDLAYDGVSVWRAHFENIAAGSIRELDPNNLNGPALQVDNLDFGPVGMTHANGQLWITAWGQQQVGTWDPLSNTFTPVFSTSPNNAGCLAFDEQSQILWVGQGGGLVVPYDLAGVQQGDGFQPFGAIPDTIDGCAFVEVTIGIEKFYTYTNNNWDPRCTEFTDIIDPDTDEVIGQECIAFRLPNVDLDEDIFADPLPQNENDQYVLEGKETGKKTVITPGQYIAVSEVAVEADQTVIVEEDFADCLSIGTVNPFSVPGGVQVVLIDSNGDVHDIDDDLAAGIGGNIVLNEDSAVVTVEDVPAGSILRVMVKFQPLNNLGMIGLECTNFERLLDESGDAFAEASAELVVVEKVQA